MSAVRLVTLDCLLHRLEAVLGVDDLLYRRFARGLRLEDEHCLTAAMSSLRLYPDEVRRVVEDTVMGWLFGAGGSPASNEMAPREAAPHP